MTENLDSHLRESLNLVMRARPGLRVLSQDEASELTARVAARFISDPSRLWWWEALREPAAGFPYQGEEGLERLDAIVGEAASDPLFMFITASNFPPWTVVAGKWDDLRELVGESSFFEFFVVSRATDWIVFDTHHNEVLVAGAHPAVARGGPGGGGQP